LKKHLELLHLIPFYHILDVSPFVSHMVEPDHQSEKLTCPLPIPSVPSRIQMTESPDQPDLMCPGKAIYSKYYKHLEGSTEFLSKVFVLLVFVQSKYDQG
jgi:hypothetical protein